MYKIYFPMTCQILTVGHIKCLKYLSNKGLVVVGLLNKKALRGYKKELVPFEDRKYILRNLAIPNILIIEQDSLDPTENILRCKCQAIASGDGWEPQELNTIKKLDLTEIDIKLDNEVVGKKYSSSSIINKLKKT